MKFTKTNEIADDWETYGMRRAREASNRRALRFFFTFILFFIIGLVIQEMKRQNGIND